MSLDFYLEMKVDTGSEEPYVVSLFSGNVTHNLNEMAKEAGIYKILWRPDENGYVVAGDIIEKLRLGVASLEYNPEYYKGFNPENGWGDYYGFLKFAKDVLEACRKHPKANISIWR